ncbi:MAG: phage integrase SAM-like domain-containing protein [Flavobacteriia bacterium]|nr:phage integrase SAM-like domain-containing protein [Flavobacteriia bacterium]
MATLNLTLDTRRARKDGTYPLVFRVRVEDKFCDIGTGFKIYKEQFDLKTNSLVNDIESNILLDQLKTHYLKRLRTYTAENLGCNDLKSMKAYLINKQPSEFTITEFWVNHIETLKTAGRYGGAKVYNTSLSVISQEIDLNIPFSKLNFKTIVDLESKLFQRGMSTNGIGVYMRSFRAICNKAIHYDIVGYEWYPFRKHKIRKEKTTPRIISVTEMTSYFNLDLEKKNPLYKTWLIGKLIFMLRGINIKDLMLLSHNNMKSGRIIYKRAKTGKLYSIEVLPAMQEIFNELNSNCTLVGILSQSEIKNSAKLLEIIVQKRKVINAHLKKIGLLINSPEPLSTYVFRYSYANILKQQGYSKDLIAEALGHEYGNSVTGIYLEQFDNHVIDEMNLKVLNSIA